VIDVAVVGGGPAGCATALALHQLGVENVEVFEATDYSVDRVGESIPPDTRLRLRDLGLWDSFLDQGHERCFGSCSSWGADELGYNDFLVNPHGDGWHLDRLRFDAWMANVVERRGIPLHRCTSVHRIQAATSAAPTRFEARDDRGGVTSLQCRFIVDATGSRARVARQIGARPHFEDHLVCVSGFLTAGPGTTLNRLTMLEAVEYGWWYAARLPDGRITASVASDASIIRAERLTDRTIWSRNLNRTNHVGPALVGSRFEPASLRTWAAPSMLLDPPAGDGWLAVGDAASSYDPISSQGIYKALDNAITAGPAIAAWLGGDPQGVIAHRIAVGERFIDYLEMRGYFYGVERRWEDAAFWRRRRADPVEVNQRRSGLATNS